MNENKLTINNLIYSLFFLIFGIFFLSGTETIIGMASKVVGSIFVITGIVKIVIYIYMKGKLGDYSINDLLIGLAAIFCGVILIMYSAAFSFAIRIIIGLWILFSSINRVILAISIKRELQDGFWVYLATGLVMFISGILLITGLFSQILGVFVIIYAISEIVDYIYFKVTYKETNISGKTQKKKKKVDRITTKKTVEADYEEEKETNLE